MIKDVIEGLRLIEVNNIKERDVQHVLLDVITESMADSDPGDTNDIENEFFEFLESFGEVGLDGLLSRTLEQQVGVMHAFAGHLEYHFA